MLSARCEQSTISTPDSHNIPLTLDSLSPTIALE